MSFPFLHADESIYPSKMPALSHPDQVLSNDISLRGLHQSCGESSLGMDLIDPSYFADTWGAGASPSVLPSSSRSAVSFDTYPNFLEDDRAYYNSDIDQQVMLFLKFSVKGLTSFEYIQAQH